MLLLFSLLKIKIEILKILNDFLQKKTLSSQQHKVKKVQKKAI
jgi:hypothetical protein